MKLKIVSQAIKWRVDINHIKKEIEVVNHNPDLYLCYNVMPKEIPIGKCLLLLIEPPLSKDRLNLYGNFDKFHTVYTYNPNGHNQFPAAINHRFDVFPYYPGCINYITRKDTTIKTRGVYFAGLKGSYTTKKIKFNNINLYPSRNKLVEFLRRTCINKSIYGNGWPNGETKMATVKKGKISWRHYKRNEIQRNNCDFVLALENSMLNNYISEKIHDGFTSDRVTLYLGAPNITDYIPQDCFVDLRKFFNKDMQSYTTKNLKQILNVINTMTQDKYDNIIYNMREYRKSVEGLHQKGIDLLTTAIIKRIKGT